MITAIAIASAMAWSNQKKNEIVGLRPEEIKWFTPPYTMTAGNERSCSAIRLKAKSGSIA
jgi:hypothetical protein